jgi:hypothetical protein
MKVCAGVFNKSRAPINPPIRLAGRGGGPQRYGIGGIGGNRRHAREQQRRKRDEAASSGNGIEGSAEHSGEKKKDGKFESQGVRCIRNRELPPTGVQQFGREDSRLSITSVMSGNLRFLAETIHLRQGYNHRISCGETFICVIES